MRDDVRATVQIAEDDWLFLDGPDAILTAPHRDDVPGVLREAERLAIQDGRHVAGFVAYEAGAAFGLATRDEQLDLPLAWFAVFPEQAARRVPSPGFGASTAGYRVGPLRPSLSRAAFDAAFVAIREHLRNGDSYQVDFTFALTGDFDGEAEALFRDLVRRQAGRYSCFLRTRDWCICSASPELFFERRGARIRMRPMKGTVARALTSAGDLEASDALRTSAKQRAENVMIVDMVRSDLGRVARVGSVQVPALFSIERYPTVWQMTSTVTAESQASLPDLFAALHPSASVTGAPKKRTMELLMELEHEPRGVYTGAVGYIAPGGDACFNVAIRTAFIDHRTRRLHFGVGSGIVWDSESAAEYDECLLKGQVLSAGPADVGQTDFALLETFRWTPSGGFWLRREHLARLAASAGHFGFAIDLERIEQALDQALTGETIDRRVRLLVAPDGAVHVEHRPMPPTRDLRVGLAAAPIDAVDVWLYHKTTRRTVYERAAIAGLDDVILWNARGEVTESTVGNVVLECDGERMTPPVRCGLLPGTFRERLLAEGTVKEGVVRVDALRELGWCWIVNSVHGWRRAGLTTGAGSPHS